MEWRAAAKEGLTASALRVGRGPRHVEAALLDEVVARVEEIARDPSRLAAPLRIVVPSESLRRHLGRALLARAGRSVLGVRVQTLYALALEVLRAAGEPPPRGSGAFPILVRRAAQEHDVLRRDLEVFDDGYRAVTATVADLLDAGLRDERLDDLELLVSSASTFRGRARALLRVAATVQRRQREAGLAREADALLCAQERLDRDPEGTLPAAGVWIHGFAEATGAASALLEALVRSRGARVFVDRPADPAEPDRTAGEAFPERLLERLGAHAPLRSLPGAAPPPRPTLLEAPGSDAEVRAVAERVAALLDAGATPERVAVVARDLGPYAVPIRSHFSRLGVPFSGLAHRGPVEPPGRRRAALLELLRRRARTALDTWLDARDDGGFAGAPLPDVRVALHSLGAARLEDAARLALGRALGDAGDLALPVRRGLSLDASDDDGPPRVYAPRRRLSRAALEAARGAARALADRLDGWPEPAPLAAHVAALRDLLRDDLGWDEAASDEVVAPLAGELPAGFPLGHAELVLLLEASLVASGGPLGGAGAGVAVLDVTEARARTHEHLFVLGVNRDAFPRLVTEDPLLPDGLRSRLRAGLPDLPVKGLGFEEERYLFAQLSASSPEVTLSWQSADDEGRARPPSPLVERLRLSGRASEPVRVSALYAAPAADAPPRPAAEHAVLAGLHGTRDDFAAALQVAVAEVAPAVADADALARARRAVIEELDPDLRSGAGRARAAASGPYLGFVGPATEPADPRNRPLFVTTVEGLARCPWQALVERLLGLEPVPDALEALPALDVRLVGSVVHAALERVVLRAFDDPPQTLGAALAREPVWVAWPPDAELARLSEAAAEDELRAAGIALPGFARALAERAAPFLAAVRRLDWAGGPLPVLGAELEGTAHCVVGDRSRPILFRVDRVDGPGGELELTDYKTGRPRSGLDARQPETRHAHLLRQVGEGRLLQVVAYLSGAGRGRGRYLFAHPDAAPDAAVAAVAADEPAFGAAWARALESALAAWDEGSFFPRLLRPEGDREADACRWCRVSEACMRGDAGVRRRLRDWTRAGSDAPPSDPAERAWLGLWALPLRARGSP